MKDYVVGIVLLFALLILIGLFALNEARNRERVMSDVPEAKELVWEEL
jgi:hypothetical protein